MIIEWSIYHDVEQLALIEGSINENGYKTILEDHLIPSKEGLYSPSFQTG